MVRKNKKNLLIRNETPHLIASWIFIIKFTIITIYSKIKQSHCN